MMMGMLSVRALNSCVTVKLNSGSEYNFKARRLDSAGT